MGCFDFTYCDNGENIRGGHGYIYITKDLQKEAKLPNPIPFDWTDEYGNFTCRIKKEVVQIDIYALYASMLYLENKNDNIDNLKFVQSFVDCLKNKTFKEEIFKTSMNKIRSYGIEIFHKNLKNIKKVNSNTEQVQAQATVKALGNQREKTVWCDEVCFAKIPLLISKKKLPQEKEGDLSDIASNWGFVTTDDPNQGFSATHNCYCRYLYTGEKMNNLDKIKKIQELQSKLEKVYGKIIDADVVLCDIMTNANFKIPELSNEIFEIYNNSQDKKSCEYLFYSLTGIELNEYLDKCISTIEEQLKERNIKL